MGTCRMLEKFVPVPSCSYFHSDLITVFFGGENPLVKLVGFWDPHWMIAGVVKRRPEA